MFLRKALQIIKDPSRQVAELGERTGLRALRAIRNTMLADRTGRRILREKPIVHSSVINMTELSKLPKDTFGYAYTQFLKMHNVTPDSRTDIKFIKDTELAYVMTRYRQVHDFWHTLTELPVSVEAEVGLKLFEYFQTGLPMNAFAATFGNLALTSEERSIYFNLYVPWAISSSMSSANLMNVMYEEHFEDSLDYVQSLLGFRGVQ